MNIIISYNIISKIDTDAGIKINKYKDIDTVCPAVIDLLDTWYPGNDEVRRTINIYIYI